MSVIVVAKLQGDTAKFQQALSDRSEEFAKIADSARTQGAIHHRFGIGDGFVMVVDEWETPGHFQQFFADPALQAFIASAGGAPEPPEVIIAAAITSSDQF
jgi:hypothetical protein